MSRLKDRDVTPDVSARGEPKTADESGEAIGDDVAKHVSGHQDAINLQGFSSTTIICASILVDQSAIPGYSLEIFFASASIIPEVSRMTFGFHKS